MKITTSPSTDDLGQPPVRRPRAGQFPLFVAEQLGYYVYLLRDPRSGEIFYVGKGTGDRVFAHAKDAIASDQETPKADRIRAIIASNEVVATELLRFGLDEPTAFEIEAAAIELLGLTSLLNVVGGHRSQDHGRMSTDDAIQLVHAEPVDITVPAILIRPSRLWYRGMPESELFEATAGWWRVGPRRNGARYAFAVANGVIRGAWEIHGWRPRQKGDRGWQDDPPGKPRWGFEGSAATQLEDYLGRSVARYWKPGAQTPFTYVNC